MLTPNQRTILRRKSTDIADGKNVRIRCLHAIVHCETALFHGEPVAVVDYRPRADTDDDEVAGHNRSGIQPDACNTAIATKDLRSHIAFHDVNPSGKVLSFQPLTKLIIPM